ncbi:MAG: hypothetical protein M3481_09405 [Actinomycetota bacterium]|nr:hypothetical protein [Actinomycetota bacterium]
MRARGAHFLEARPLGLVFAHRVFCAPALGDVEDGAVEWRTVERGQRYVGVLTDGHAWALFHAQPDGRRPRSHSSERGNALAPLT